jgi:hypothetical protein
MKLIKITLVLMVLLISAIHSISQGTTYISNLQNQPQTHTSVGSDSWMAAYFNTGSNTNGYILNSIQLLMGNSTGSASGMVVSLYTLNVNGFVPETNLGTLSGTDPTSAGTYTFSSSSISLSPSSRYFIVLKSGTPVSTGAFTWGIGSGGFSVADGWSPGGSYIYSADGLNWLGYRPNPFQYAINATAIPEPATTSLIAIGVITLGLYRRTSRS